MGDLYTPEQRAAMAGDPDYCRALSPIRAGDLRFMCERPAGHDGTHQGFGLPDRSSYEAAYDELGPLDMDGGAL